MKPIPMRGIESKEAANKDINRACSILIRKRPIKQRLPVIKKSLNKMQAFREWQPRFLTKRSIGGKKCSFFHMTFGD